MRALLLAVVCLWVGLGCSAAPATPPAAAPRPNAQADQPRPAGTAEGPRPLRPLKFSYATEASVSAPIWIAKEMGLFEKYGIDAELVFIRGSATNMQALLSGSIDMSLSGSAAVVSASLAGADVPFLATTEVVTTQALVTASTITDPQQLRGKTIGLGLAGGSSGPQLAEALRRLGLQPSDVQMIDIALSNDRIAALVGGSIDGMLAPQAVTERAAGMGFHVMLNLWEAGIPNQGQSIIAPRTFVEANREVVKDVLRAFCEAIYVELTDRSAAERAIAKWTRIDDPQRLDAEYRASATFLQKKPYPSVPAVRVALEASALEGADVRGITPERLIDDSILRELDTEGFIDALWSRS